MVKQENDTRWNSFYESAKRAIQLKDPLTFSSAEWLMTKTDSNAFLLNIVFGRMTGHFSASRLIFSIHSSVSPKVAFPTLSTLSVLSPFSPCSSFSPFPPYSLCSLYSPHSLTLLTSKHTRFGSREPRIAEVAASLHYLLDHLQRQQSIYQQHRK